MLTDVAVLLQHSFCSVTGRALGGPSTGRTLGRSTARDGCDAWHAAITAFFRPMPSRCRHRRLSVYLSVRMLVNVRACFASPSAHPLRTDVRQLRPSVGIATIHPAAAASEADAADADRQCVYTANLNDSAASYPSYCVRCCLGKSPRTFEAI